MKSINIFLNEKLRINKDTNIEDLSEDVKELISLISTHIDNKEAIKALEKWFIKSGIKWFQAYFKDDDYKNFKKLTKIETNPTFINSKIFTIGFSLYDKLKDSLLGGPKSSHLYKHQVYPENHDLSLLKTKLFLYEGDDNCGCWISTINYNILIFKRIKKD